MEHYQLMALLETERIKLRLELDKSKVDNLIHKDGEALIKALASIEELIQTTENAYLDLQLGELGNPEPTPMAMPGQEAPPTTEFREDTSASWSISFFIGAGVLFLIVAILAIVAPNLCN